MRQFYTAHREVFGHHAEIGVPALVVARDLLVQLLKRKRCNVVRQRVPRVDPGCLLVHIVLVLDDPDYHTLQNLVSLASVRVSLREFTARQRVIAIVKLGNVAPKVLRDGELATRVDPFVAISAQD